jgi:flagellar L-ring protein precursor FlgH
MKKTKNYMSVTIRKIAANIFFNYLVFITIILLWGCSKSPIVQGPSTPSNVPEQIQILKTEMLEYEDNMRVPVEEGSLWSEESGLNSLFVNQKARRVGDVVTIQIVESSKASNKASTDTGRKSSLSAGLSKFFGGENNYTAADPFFNPFGSINSSFDRSFEGSGSTQRSGDLNAYLTARVVDVLPNGNLVLIGTREVGVNNEKQLITLSGIVRSKDISSDNQIKSIHISDAKISYSGRGAVNDPQRPGWLVRVFDAIWPF